MLAACGARAPPTCQPQASICCAAAADYSSRNRLNVGSRPTIFHWPFSHTSMSASLSMDPFVMPSANMLSVSSHQRRSTQPASKYSRIANACKKSGLSAGVLGHSAVTPSKTAFASTHASCSVVRRCSLCRASVLSAVSTPDNISSMAVAIRLP